MQWLRSSGFAGRGVAIVSVLAFATAGCGGESPGSGAPTAPTNPAPTTATITGQVVSLNGGAPLGGIAVDANGVTATSDSQGMFSVTIPAGASAERLVLTAPQIRVWVRRMNASARRAAGWSRP